MNKAFLKKEMVLWLIILAPVILMIIIWDKLPDQLPSHWGMDGEVNGYMSKWIYPFFNVGIYLLLLLIPKIDPRKKNYDIFSSSYYMIRLLFTCFASAVLILVLFKVTGLVPGGNKLILPAVFFLLTVFGNYMGNIRPNWFIGFRTPWTLENETVWKKTHLLASRIWVAGGICGLVGSLMVEGKILHFMFITIIIIMTAVPIIYSYILFKKLKEQGDPPENK